MSDRLFVPLASQPFEWFVSGEKHWELRRYGRQWTDKHVYHGRKVELRKGYSGESLWGTIEDTVAATGLNAMFAKVPFYRIAPGCQSASDAVDVCKSILHLADGDAPRLLAFKVKISN